MSNADRHRLIAQAVKDSGSATVPELAELTGASEMTIRRDLDTLAAQGILERFRGGARPLLLPGQGPPFARRAHAAVDPQRRTGAQGPRPTPDAATLLPPSRPPAPLPPPPPAGQPSARPPPRPPTK